MPAYYRATFQEFESHSDTEIVGVMAVINSQSRFPLKAEQIDAWLLQLPALRDCVELLSREFNHPEWSVLLEYPIPLLGDRLDCALLCGGVIVVIEFKSGELSSSAARRQAEDYAANLANFHEGSAGRPIQTVVAAGQTLSVRKFRYSFVAGHNELASAVMEALAAHQDATNEFIDAAGWDRSRFKPIPPIINAAVQLYEHKDVFAIEHACAPVESLTSATDAIVKVVSSAQSSTPKSICFVTGVPGAGKTLVGLNAVHHPQIQSSSTFLSGNGPLIDVIREALLRDARKRRGLTRAAALPEINAFIHSVHRFAELFVGNDMVPIQATLVFDEAQRAWDRERNLAQFDRDISEPEMLLEIMDRREKATIVALVGGGQEINSGEAGLAEWGRALQRFPDWQVHASPEVLRGGSATAGFRLFETVENPVNYVAVTPELHLHTNVRSIRGKFVAEWVNSLLEGELEKASKCASDSPFKINVTRSITELRKRLRQNRKGNETAGLVGSASAARLRAEGLEYSFAFHKDFDWENWFLDTEEDVRSCNRLEVFATQFEIQGLELDWVGMCWSEDFVFENGAWHSKNFHNKGWRENKNPTRHFFRKNAYRVLLTRARQGMTLFVPIADPEDNTRLAAHLDETYRALIDAGAVPLS
jgi:DUF2075 family protein